MLCLLALPWGSAYARPKIGLVLGGGGAAGISHVGVLKVLEENHIPIDYIAGNSMGAIIGSLYASGLSADEIEKVAKQLDWPTLFQDDPGYALKSYDQKKQAADFFNTLTFGVSKEGVKFPGGLIGGQRLMFELRRLLAPTQKYNNFDQLPIPFRAVATDIRTGETVVLKDGNLATAVRASMSIPGIFTPVTINNRLLVDGLVSNNVPVDVARDMGADILIVSRIPAGKPRPLNSALDISLQTMDLLMSKTSQAQIDSLTKSDILIEPPIGDIGSLDFSRVNETIPIGIKGARAKLPALQALAAQLGTLNQPLARAPKAVMNSNMLITSVVIDNRSSLNNDLVRKKLNINVGDVINEKRLQAGLDRIYSLGYFGLVDYDLTPNPQGGYNLKVTANEAAEGNKRVSIGFSLADDFNGDSRYQAGAKYVRQGLTDKGTELRAEGIIGERLLASAELYHPLIADEKNVFVAPKVWYQERDATIDNEAQQIAELRAHERGVSVDIGRTMSNTAEVRAGMFYQKIRPQVKTGAFDLQDKSNIVEAGVKLQYQSDTLDSINFPTKGGRFSASVSHGLTALGSHKDYSRLELEGEQVWTRGKHHVIASGRAVGNTNNDAGLLYANNNTTQIGRLAFGNSDQWLGNYAVDGAVTYMRQISEIPKIAKVHVGVSAGLGQKWRQVDDVDVDIGNLRSAGTVFLGGETAIGPAFVGVRKMEDDNSELYFNFGRDF